MTEETFMYLAVQKVNLVWNGNSISNRDNTFELQKRDMHHVINQSKIIKCHYDQEIFIRVSFLCYFVCWAMYSCALVIATQASRKTWWISVNNGWRRYRVILLLKNTSFRSHALLLQISIYGAFEYFLFLYYTSLMLWKTVQLIFDMLLLKAFCVNNLLAKEWWALFVIT